MKLYNTLTRQIDDLQPLNDKTVKIYTCGLTVYSQPHIGNWLGYIYWDVLVRTLRVEGYTVERTQNITDVGHLTSDDDNGEDKMEKGAKNEGITAWDVAEKYIAIANQEASELNLAAPEHLARATDYIDQQIAFAKILEDKGYTYIIPSDGLYFDTSKLNNYGELAQLDIAGLEAGARVSVEGKRNITDFAIWKFSPKDVKRDMEWDSPWGAGFPGWHLECSVIARETLGDQIDIHTGGIDHIPVHHSNEIAQTEAVTGQQFSQFWVHNNHLKADGQKMSKSLGNIYTLRDITDHGFSPDSFRMFALQKHYRTEGNFTWENLEAAANRLQKWQRIGDLRHQLHDGTSEAANVQYFENHTDIVRNALRNDLDTVQALNEIDIVMNDFTLMRKNAQTVSAFTMFTEFVELITGLSVLRDDISTDIKETIKQRQLARNNNDWARSDELRSELEAKGVGINDQGSPVWYWL